MLKTTILFLALTTSQIVFSSQASSLKVTWFGTTCFNISDGQDALFFDPFITRPSLFDVITFKTLAPDTKLVDHWLSKIDYTKVKAIFVSHAHYDHVLDLAYIQKKTSAMIYGSQSTINIAKGRDVPVQKMLLSKVHSTFQIGNFKVTVLKNRHSPHIANKTFMNGSINAPLNKNASFYQFKMGEVFSYYIQHPKGNIFFNPSSTMPSGEKMMDFKAKNFVIQGVANMGKDERKLIQIYKKLKIKTVIISHHDNIFKPLSDGFHKMPLQNYDSFLLKLREEVPEVKVLNLKYGKSYFLN